MEIEIYFVSRKGENMFVANLDVGDLIVKKLNSTDEIIKELNTSYVLANKYNERVKIDNSLLDKDIRSIGLDNSVLNIMLKKGYNNLRELEEYLIKRDKNFTQEVKSARLNRWPYKDKGLTFRETDILKFRNMGESKLKVLKEFLIKNNINFLND